MPNVLRLPQKCKLQNPINTKEMYIFPLMWYTIHCCDKAFKEIMEGKFYTGET